MPKHFIKLKSEKTICGNCKKEFTGGGYVNHCPHCLWSKHVDEDIPGDRKSTCLGLMKPIKVITGKREKISIKHYCQKCGKEMLNKISPNDNMEEIIKLSTKHDKHGNI